jgi:predicted O-methyltransferase YrrM
MGAANIEFIQDRLNSRSEIEEPRSRFADIPGFLLDQEGYLLLLLAKYGPGDGEIVEIGSFMGKSTCWLAAGAASAGREKVTAIDTFQGSPEHHDDPDLAKALATGKLFDGFCYMLVKHELQNQVTPIIGDSHAAAATWNQPLRLLFIDGDHSYEAVARDFADWEKHVVPGGVACFHDVDSWEGVTRFYTQDLPKHPNYREILRAGSLRACIKLRA